VTGKSHAEAQIELEKADIVLDQLLLGGFGSLSVEAMSLGRPVVCYLIDEVKKEHYDDCPIHVANIDNVKEKIAELLNSEPLRKRLGLQGQVFIKQHFDYEKINQQILELYQDY
jgi:glycosyltransferase involved in cell wall biosynthesis